MKLNRRTLIKNAGAGFLLAPFYDLLTARPARAQAGRCKRLFIFHTQPCDTGTWNPGAVMGENSFNLPDMLAALNEVKKDIVLLDGLAPKQPGDNHYSPHALTGVGREGRPDGGNISIEQFIGDQLEKTPEKRPIKTLLLGTGAKSEAVFYRNSMRLQTIASPLSAYNTVFANAASNAPGMSPSALLAQRKSVLDLVREDANELKGVLGASEKAKLDLHLESIRQFELRLASTANVVACSKPAAPSDDRSSVSKETLADMAFLDLAISAFACDTTRLAAVQWGNSHTWKFDTPTGLRGELHMGIIHVSRKAEAVKIENWLAGQFAGVIKKLQAIPEADGSGTLFDNTLVVWTRDFGDANSHNSRNMKFILAQGKGGYLKTNPAGRYIKGVAGNNRQERILLNLAEAMGVTNFTGFGDISAEFKPNKIPLPELRG